MSGFFDVRIEHTGLDAVLAKVEQTGESIEEHLPVIAEMLVGGVHDVFEAQGPGWQALADSTLAKRRAQGRGAQILQDSGVAAGSIGAGIGPDYAEAVAGVPYLIYHSSSEPRQKIPLRNPFDLGPFLDPLMDDVAELLTSKF